jgi:predicted O-methyltransferase YrrM
VRRRSLDAYLATFHGIGAVTNGIEGWFDSPDVELFQSLTAWQTALGLHGDILEIGAYRGKSTILLGFTLAPNERLFVCDLFETLSRDDDNQQENCTSYGGLTRQVFENNYRKWHDTLPVVLQGESAEQLDSIEPGSVRFAHVDGGHLYAQVEHDLRAVRRLLADDGIVVVDDWRSPHTPGTTSAVFEQIFCNGLQPFCATDAKLYASWSERVSAEMADRITQWVARQPGLTAKPHRIAGGDLIRVEQPGRGRPTRQARREAERLAARALQHARERIR